MKRNTIVKTYVLIMTILCLSLSSMLVYLSITRMNDWACNILAVIIALVIPLVWTLWPSNHAHNIVNDSMDAIDIYSQRAFRKQYRAALKKHLQSLN